MNYLSHYYIDRAWASKEFGLGTLLVDLCRMRGKGFRLRPLAERKALDLSLLEVDAGVKRHYAVDAWWHNCKAFGQMRALFKAAVVAEGLVLERGSFLSHIGVEMLLDRQLMAAYPGLEPEFFELMNSQNKGLATEYLKEENTEWVILFEAEWEAFRNRRFLRDYADLEHFSQIVAGIYAHVTKDRLEWGAVKRVIERLEKGQPNLLAELF